MKLNDLLRMAALAAVTGGCFVASAVASGNLVVNGSFENGYPAVSNGPGWQAVGYLGYPSDLIPGWTQTGGGVDWHLSQSDPEPAAQDGSYTIDLIGTDAAGAIQQDVPTTTGGQYALSFYYAGHPLCIGGGSASALVSAGTSSTVVTSGATNTYTPVTLNFTGTGASTPISFQSDTASGCGGVLIDNVSAEQMPTTKDQCKKGGWRSYGIFENQGECVRFVATGGKHTLR
ncbi:MAG: hypothetical protein JWO17_2195 [Actinomycetia bacterium]|nr:hypothetical protein [Actinomycetes bacterium]